MPKFAIFSDIHLEFGKWKNPPTEVDAVLACGDIGVGKQGLAWLDQTYSKLEIPVYYIAGNHEFYQGRDINEHYIDLMESAKLRNINFLQNTSHIFDCGGEKIGIVGATLWTDFCSAGTEFQKSVMNTAEYQMNDYRHIKENNKSLTTTKILHEHLNSLKMIKLQVEEFKKCNIEKIIVMTHHAPSFLSVHPRYIKDSFMNALYYSCLEEYVLDSGITLWCHGHVHDSFDYKIGQTRVIANPRGYVGYEVNQKFDPNFIVEI